MNNRRSMLLCLIMILVMSVTAFAGCTSEGEGVSASNPEDLEQIEQLEDENQELKDSVKELEEKVGELEGLLESQGIEVPVEKLYATGINCTLNGEEVVEFEGTVSLTAAVSASEGMVLDYWTINGSEIQGNENEITLDVSEDTIIKAVLREELKVISTNAYIQLLASNGSPEGDKLHEYVFENEENKKVSIYVCAEIPGGYEVDYWIIDGSPYYFSREIKYFKAFDLHKATTYEVVLKKKNAPAATAAPTAKPTSAPTASPTPIPEYVNVGCTNATFSGGGHSGSSSGQVVKGTTITVTGTNPVGSPVYWLINGAYSREGQTSFSYTVNSNTTFVYSGHN